MATPLTDDALRKYGASRNFLPQEEDDQGPVVVTALDFHAQGELCVAARNDGVLSLINCLSGTVSKTIFTRRYGVELAKFTHHPDCVIFTSLNEANDHRIRYHSFYDNSFLRYYNGHTARVASLSMHPAADEFMSASVDGTIRLWDIRSSECAALIRADHMPVSHICSAYDQEGVVFGVYSDDHLIRMYDARNYQEGPFAKFSLYDASIVAALQPFLARAQAPNLDSKRLHATEIKFSPDGNNLLVATNRGPFLQLDAFDGHLVHMFTEHVGPQHHVELKLGSAYSPDGAYVTTGSEDGRIFVYRAASGELVHALPRGHAGPVVDLQWNPQRHLLASAGANSTVFWTAG